jgi:F-type H+-transporting ATPase subunit a
VNIYSYFDHSVSWVIQSALVTCAVLLWAGVSVRKKISAEGGGVVPDEGMSLRNMIEVIIEGLSTLAEQRMGPEWRKYFPLVATIFFFILISNVMSLVPGLAGPTTDANTTFSWALIAWMYYTYVGISKHKGKYLIKFMGPSFGKMEIGGHTIHLRWLAPFMLILEIPLDFARILTLGIRLLANMFADHTVVAVWIKMVPIGIPAIFMGLGLVVSILQAFIFALLTMIYIGLALEEPH